VADCHSGHSETKGNADGGGLPWGPARGLRGSRVTRVAHMRDTEMRVTSVKIEKSTNYKK
jgi:hypothetical protein